MSQFFTSGGQSIAVSASASILPMNTGLISFRIDWFDHLVALAFGGCLFPPQSLAPNVSGSSEPTRGPQYLFRKLSPEGCLQAAFVKRSKELSHRITGK